MCRLDLVRVKIWNVKTRFSLLCARSIVFSELRSKYIKNMMTVVSIEREREREHNQWFEWTRGACMCVHVLNEILSKKQHFTFDKSGGVRRQTPFQKTQEALSLFFILLLLYETYAWPQFNTILYSCFFGITETCRTHAHTQHATHNQFTNNNRRILCTA